MFAFLKEKNKRKHNEMILRPYAVMIKYDYEREDRKRFVDTFANREDADNYVKGQINNGSTDTYYLFEQSVDYQQPDSSVIENPDDIVKQAS